MIYIHSCVAGVRSYKIGVRPNDCNFDKKKESVGRKVIGLAFWAIFLFLFYCCNFFLFWYEIFVVVVTNSPNLWPTVSGFILRANVSLPLCIVKWWILLDQIGFVFLMPNFFKKAFCRPPPPPHTHTLVFRGRAVFAVFRLPDKWWIF